MTRAELQRALTWFRRRFGLQRYRVRLYTAARPPKRFLRDDTPDTVGEIDVHCYKNEAELWVPIARCKQRGEDVLGVLFHEGMHLAAQHANIEGAHPPQENELLWDKVGWALADLYMLQRAKDGR